MFMDRIKVKTEVDGFDPRPPDDQMGWFDPAHVKPYWVKSGTL